MPNPKSRLGLSKQDRDNIRLYGERNRWEQRLYALNMANKYVNNGIKDEMERKITQWKLFAQEAAMALLPYYKQSQDSYATQDGLDDDMSTMLKSLGINPALIRYSVDQGDFDDNV